MIAELERLIEQAVNAGGSLDEIEAEIITAAPVDREVQAALWLYAEALEAHRGDSVHELILPAG